MKLDVFAVVRCWRTHAARSGANWFAKFPPGVNHKRLNDYFLQPLRILLRKIVENPESNCIG